LDKWTNRAPKEENKYKQIQKINRPTRKKKKRKRLKPICVDHYGHNTSIPDLSTKENSQNNQNMGI